MSEKIKCFKITPSGDTRVDSIYVKADKTWRRALDEVEASMDEQFSDDNKDWADIKVTVECCELTREEWDDLNGEW
jgi:hypothetical protein